MGEQQRALAASNEYATAELVLRDLELRVDASPRRWRWPFLGRRPSSAAAAAARTPQRAPQRTARSPPAAPMSPPPRPGDPFPHLPRRAGSGSGSRTPLAVSAGAVGRSRSLGSAASRRPRPTPTHTTVFHLAGQPYPVS